MSLLQANAAELVCNGHSGDVQLFVMNEERDRSVKCVNKILQLSNKNHSFSFRKFNLQDTSTWVK